MAAVNTSAETPLVALSATAEKASSCSQMNVLVKVEIAPEWFYSNSGTVRGSGMSQHNTLCCVHNVLYVLSYEAKKA